MFLPSLIPSAHLFWLDDEPDTRYLRLRKNVPNTDRRRQQTLRNALEPPSAPPLSSYSSNCVGVSFLSVPSHERLDNAAESRLAYLESIRTYGFTTLKPLGVGKTMQSMLEERIELQEARETAVENIGDEGLSDDAVFQDPETNLLTRPEDEGTGFGSTARHAAMEDLDAAIPDADDDHEFGATVYLSDIVFEDQDDEFGRDVGFMADEEEYEDVDEGAPPSIVLSSAAPTEATRPENELSLGRVRAGTRNVSTSTRISSLNPELQEQLDRLNMSHDVSAGGIYGNSFRANSLNADLHLDADMYNLFSRNSTRDGDSDMEIE